MHLKISLGKLFNFEAGKDNKVISRLASLLEGDNFGYTNVLGLCLPDNYKNYMEAYGNEIYVYACTYLISNAIAGLPLKIYRPKLVKGEIQKEEWINHPARKLFNNPNDFQDSQELVESHVANQLLTGNSYMLLDEKRGKIPTKIYSLNSSKIRIVPHPEKYIAGYLMMLKNGQKIEIPEEDIIHGKFFNPNNDFYGLSALSAGRESVSTIQSARVANRKIFKNGTLIDAVLEAEGELSDEVYERMKVSWNQRNRGVQNSHGTPILESGTKYKPIGLSQRDMEYIQGQKLNREEICAIFLVPPILLGVLEDASYNNIREAQKILWEYAIVPKLKRFANVYTEITRLYGTQDSFCGFDTEAVQALKEDLKKTIEIADKAWRMGVPMNTLSKSLNLPWSDVPGGDKAYIPFNMIEAGSTQQAPKPTPKPDEGKKNILDYKSVKLIKWSEERLEAKWKGFVQTSERIAKAYRGDLAKFFTEQEKTVTANLNKFKSLKYEVLSEKLIVLYTIEKATRLVHDENLKKDVPKEVYIKRTVNVESVLFSSGKQVKKLQKVNLPHHTDAFEASGNAEFELLGIEASFDVENPRAQKWLEKNALRRATQVNDTVRDDLKKQLLLGLKEGEGIPQLKKRIEKLYSDYNKPEGYKTIRIARTEVIGASNEGSVESYKQAGVKKKGWLTAFDGRERETHAEAHQRYKEGIPVGQNFEVGGATGSSPGNLSSADENANCRCSVYPILE